LKRGRSQSCGCYNKERVIETNFNSGIDYTGHIFGRLTVLSEVERWKSEDRKMLDQCSCPNKTIREYTLASLRGGKTTSCGCYKTETTIERQTMQVKDYQERHPIFCQVEDIMDDPNGLGILVRCKYSECHGWMKPTRDQLSGRIAAIEKLNKKSPGTELNFYCSNGCKYSCDTYRAQTTPKLLRNVRRRARCNQHINRKALLDLQIDEFGYNYCEKCGKRFDSKDLALHHNIMVSLDPGMADDMSHQLLCCVEHHEHKGC